MPKYRVVVGGTFRDVWSVESETVADAAKDYLTAGKELKAESSLTVTDVWASEMQTPEPAASKKSDPKKPRRKRRTKAEIAAAKAAEADAVQRGRSVE